MGAYVPANEWFRYGKPHTQAVTQTANRHVSSTRENTGIDMRLLTVSIILLCLGLVMVTSASITIADRLYGEPFYYLYRQSIHILVGLLLAGVLLRVKMDYLEKYGSWIFVLGVLLLALVLVPGIGKEVNGSTRWLSFGILNMQPSELMKLGVVLYVAGYLVRHGEEVRTSFWGFLKPMLLLMVVCLLLLLEPDFGASAIIVATTLGMMFLGGVRLWQFALLLLLVVSILAVLAMSSPYRLERLTVFINPWADPFNHGFQLTQALIAFGRGEWFGVGLGGSVQKLFYLPEAHTDFLFAVFAEELGMIAGLMLLLLFVYVIWRAFSISAQADRLGRLFESYLAAGIGTWIGLQAFINFGVNMGLLPTKGLTLPLMSYGGSSIVIMCMAIALLLRIDYENRLQRAGEKP